MPVALAAAVPSLFAEVPPDVLVALGVLDALLFSLGSGLLRFLFTDHGPTHILGQIFTETTASPPQASCVGCPTPSRFGELTPSLASTPTPIPSRSLLLGLLDGLLDLLLEGTPALLAPALLLLDALDCFLLEATPAPLHLRLLRKLLPEFLHSPPAFAVCLLELLNTAPRVRTPAAAHKPKKAPFCSGGLLFVGDCKLEGWGLLGDNRFRCGRIVLSGDIGGARDCDNGH